MTTKKFKTVLFASMLAAILIPSGMMNAEAVMYNNWSDGSHTYTCTNSIRNDLVTTSAVSNCGDLATSANVWNTVANSSWSLTSVTVGEVPVFACDTASLGYVVATPNYPASSPDISDAYMCISSQYTMGDIPAGDTNAYDYVTLLIHEWGHVAGLDHSTTAGSVMVQGQSQSDVRLVLHTSDEGDLQGAYP